MEAITSQEDDPSLPTLTVRVFVIGLILCCVGSAVSQLFYFKSNAPTFSSFFVILVSIRLCQEHKHLCSDVWYLDIFANGQPDGRAFRPAYRTKWSDESTAQYMPDKQISLFNMDIPLNPGPFSVKEHLLVTILATSGSEAAYAGDILGMLTSSGRLSLRSGISISRTRIILSSGHWCSPREGQRHIS